MTAHPFDAGAGVPVSWVDQARDIARKLHAALYGDLDEAETVKLFARIRTDPALFWLRGEEQPPGEWREPS